MSQAHENGREGTEPGYRAHLRLKEPTCEPCRRAHAEKWRRDIARFKVRHEAGELGWDAHSATDDHPEGREGTVAGYNHHMWLGEEACDACFMAHHRYRADLEHQRKLDRQLGVELVDA